jgi:hypothetical protein
MKLGPVGIQQTLVESVAIKLGNVLETFNFATYSAFLQASRIWLLEHFK